MKGLRTLLANKFIWLFVLAIGTIFAAHHYWQAECDITGWIQAGGSILAIIAGFWIADVSQKSAQAERKKSIFAVAEAAHVFSKQLRELLEKPGATEPLLSLNTQIYNLYHRDITDGFACALANIPFHEVGSSEAVQAILSMQAQFGRFLPNTVEKLLNGPLSIPEINECFQQFKVFQPSERMQKETEFLNFSFNSMKKAILMHLDRIDADFEIVSREMAL